jgi:hypothetical protein
MKMPNAVFSSLSLAKYIYFAANAWVVPSDAVMSWTVFISWTGLVLAFGFIFVVVTTGGL